MITITNFINLKKQNIKFASLTAYDATFSRLFFENGIEIMLVGDSLGMTIQGHDTTLPVTIENIVYHTTCVRRGAPNCFLLSDLPFMSYATLNQTFQNAEKLIKSGANMVKLEINEKWLINTVKQLVLRSIPVCGHIGLTPQSINILGGYKIQGRDPINAEKILNYSIELENSGAQMLLLECIPSDLAKRITKLLKIPVIGIGAGLYTDGQILVMQDFLGISKKIPSFAKNFFEKNKNIKVAIHEYVKEVRNGQFPSK